MTLQHNLLSNLLVASLNVVLYNKDQYVYLTTGLFEDGVECDSCLDSSNCQHVRYVFQYANPRAGCCC
eukprot:m.310809 g.310809  ORF g.310809 m.310809 type:complete len:68 (-) comp16480_c0_seq2:1115-1318(-)